MSSIFPLREKVTLGEGREPRLVDLDDDVADEVFDALSSKTTRQVFSELHETPQTASDLAEVTDTTVQNAKYHLEKLVAADLVEVVDTWYSERGTEMKVYAPTDEAVVLFAGDDKQSALRTLLRRVVGSLAVLLPASGAVAYLAREYGQVSGPGTDAGTGEPAPQTDPVAVNGTEGTPTTDGGVDIYGANATSQDQTVTPHAEEAAQMTNETVNGTSTPTPTPENVSTATETAAASLDPAMLGVAFFLGGVFVLGLLGLWYARA